MFVVGKKIVRCIACLALTVSLVLSEVPAGAAGQAGTAMMATVGEDLPRRVAADATFDVPPGTSVQLSLETDGMDVAEYLWSDRTVGPTWTETLTEGSVSVGCVLTSEAGVRCTTPTVVFNVRAPLEAEIALRGSHRVLPGEYFEFQVVAVSGGPLHREGGFPIEQYAYEWTVAGDNLAEPEETPPYRIEPLDHGSRMRLYVLDGADAWRLYGATVSVTATLKSNEAFSATSAALPADGLEVGIRVLPSEQNMTVAPGEGNSLMLELWSVTGGDAPADELSYGWQRFRQQGPPDVWEDIAGEAAKGPAYLVEGIEKNTRDTYRCRVDLSGGTPGEDAAKSCEFGIEKEYSDPALNRPVVLKSGNVAWSGNTIAAATEISGLSEKDREKYTAFLEVYDSARDEWSEHDAKTALSGQTIDVSFEPSEGLRKYRTGIRKGQGQGQGNTFCGEPFVAVGVPAFGASGTSAPEATAGVIAVQAGRGILHTVVTEGGLGRFLATWRQGAGAARPGAPEFFDAVPDHGVPTAASAVVLLPDGRTWGGPVDVAFGTPYVDLKWNPEPTSRETGYAALASGTFCGILFDAEGGSGFTYSWSMGNMGSGTLVTGRFAPELLLFPIGTFRDQSEPLSFPVLLRVSADDRRFLEKEITLTVTFDPAVGIGGTGVQKAEEGSDYVLEFAFGDAPELTAYCTNSPFAETDEEWTWYDGDGNVLSNAPALTPALGVGTHLLTASAVLTDAADPGSDGTTISATIRITVTEEPLLSVLETTATFRPGTVAPGGSAALLFDVTPGSGEYLYQVFVDGAWLDLPGGFWVVPVGMTATANSSLTVPWKVTDLARETEPAEGLATLLIQPRLGGPAGVCFAIVPQPGARLWRGAGFVSLVLSLGNVPVENGDLDWISSSPETASVADDGTVTVHGDGQITITAVLKRDNTKAASYSVRVGGTDPAPDNPGDGGNGGDTPRPDHPLPKNYKVFFPSLVFSADTTIVFTITTKPAAAVTFRGLPDGLEAQGNGSVIGELRAGRYRIDKIMVEWDRHRTVYSDVPLQVNAAAGPDPSGSDGRHGGGDGGGCDSGFGILAPALGGFWALKRRGSSSAPGKTGR